MLRHDTGAYLGGCPLRCAVFVVLFACLICVTSAFASGGDTIVLPTNGATVSGSVAISIVADPGVSWSNFYIDGSYYASTPPSTITWNTTKFANGVHTISTTAFAANKTVLGSPSIKVTVTNPAVALKLSSPVAGSQVSGAVTIAANQPTGVQWENFYVDGVWMASTPPASFSWKSTQVANGPHTISVISYGASGKMGADSASVTVVNGPAAQASTPATAAPTPAATKAPTVAPTPVPPVAPTPVPTVAPTPVPTAVPTKAPTPVPTVAPTPVPTVAPTPVPTVAPTAVPTVAPTVAPSATPTTTPTAAATPVTTAQFFVSTSGSDGNNGMSPNTAWRTIQHAVNTMPSGETAIVAQGTYNERVSIVRDGVTIQADPNAASTPVVQGFDIGADNVTVDGFEITLQNNSTPNGYGIYIHDASNAVVENNYIHDLCHDGVMLDSSASNIQVLNNTIVHAQMSGIEIDGTGALVQGNDISATYQYPAVLGGIFAACTSQGSGADADAIRFFGSNHIIRANYLHDIEYDFGNTALPNPSPHIDCFQTWGESGENTSNILIDRNWCAWPSNGSLGTHAEISSIEALEGPVGNITYQNNVFQDMIRGVNATQDGGQVIGQLNFYNNTFDHLTQEAIIVDGGARNDNVENNIFYDIIGGDGFISYSSGENFLDNVFYTRAGAPSGGRYWGGGAAPAFQAVNPLFVSTGNSVGVGANYNLCVAGQNGCTATSTIGHAGALIPSITADYTGVLRSGGISIGAYQMSQ